MSSKHVACAEKLMSTAIVFSTLPSANTAPVHWNSFCEALSRPCVQQTQCLCRKVDAETEQMRSLCRKAGSQTERMRSLCRKVEAAMKHPSSRREACAEKLMSMSSNHEACAHRLMSTASICSSRVSTNTMPVHEILFEQVFWSVGSNKAAEQDFIFSCLCSS